MNAIDQWGNFGFDTLGEILIGVLVQIVGIVAARKLRLDKPQCRANDHTDKSEGVDRADVASHGRADIQGWRP